jgi:hypothetical protein
MAELAGFNDRRFNAREGSRPTQGTLVPKGHSKVSSDPSQGTARSRSQVMEVGGARYRVEPPGMLPPANTPFSDATQANGRIVRPSAAVSRDKDYTGYEEDAFEDASVVAGVDTSRQRLRGYTTRG